VDAGHFEAALTGPCPHESSDNEIQFAFPENCKVMVDSGIRILSLANQLSLATKRVRLVFQEGEPGTMGYLNRMGFFDHLSPGIEVQPDRPAVSGAALFRGHSVGVVEIEPISPDSSDSGLPTRLSDALQRSVSDPDKAKQVGNAAFTVFAELIQNIHYHAETPINGFAALQRFPQSDKVKVAVSDSGKGILDTLRPSLASLNPRLTRLSDTDIVVEAFRTGLSRHGLGRGCGLKASADHALKYKAELDVRLPKCRVHLEPSPDGYQAHLARCSDEGSDNHWNEMLR